MLQRLLGGARNEQAHEPRIWSMWYGAWVAVNTHTSSPIQCKWGETQNIKGDPASRGLSSNFSTYTSFIAILCIQSGFRPFTGHYSEVFFPICHGTIKYKHGTINRAPSKNIPKDSGWQSAPSPGIALMILQTPPTRPLAGRGANEPLALVLRPFRSCLLLLLALFRCLPVHLVPCKARSRCRHSKISRF